jgi:hypothetical protein
MIVNFRGEQLGPSVILAQQAEGEIGSCHGLVYDVACQLEPFLRRLVEQGALPTAFPVALVVLHAKVR